MGSFCTGGNTVNQTQTNTPSAGGLAALQQSQNLLSAVNPAAAPLLNVNGLNSNQTGSYQGFANVAQNNPANPYFTAGAASLGASQNPNQWQQFLNPYMGSALANMKKYIFDPATVASRTGATAAAGGQGAERSALAQQNLEKTQGDALSQAVAGYYGQAGQMGAQQQQLEQGAGALNFSAGSQAVNNALNPLMAQQGSGNNQWGYQQLPNQAQYQQQEQAFQTPMQLAQMYASLAPAYGGTTTGQTQYPQQSPLSQIAGLGMTGLGAFGAFGGFKPSATGARGGSAEAINGYAAGGWPTTLPQIDTKFMENRNKMPQMPGGMGNLGKIFGGSGTTAGADAIPGDAAPSGGANPGDPTAGMGGGSGFWDSAGNFASDVGSGISDAFSGAGDWLGGLFSGGGGDALASIGEGAAGALKDGGFVNPFEVGGYIEGGDVDVDRALKGDFAEDNKNVKVTPGDYVGAEFDRLGQPDKYDNPGGPPLPSVITNPAGGGSGFRAQGTAGVSGYADENDEGRSPVPDPIPQSRNPLAGTPGAGDLPPIPKFKSTSGDLSQNPWMALVKAGLTTMQGPGRDARGLMNGTNPLGQLGNALGKGGLEGTKTLEEQAKQKNTQELAKYHAAMQQVPYREMTAAQKAQNVLEARKLELTAGVPSGYRRKKDGDLEPIPGGPASPEQISAASQAKINTTAIYTPEEAEAVAQRYLETGNRMVLAGLGMGNVGSINKKEVNAAIERVKQRDGITNQQIAQREAEFEGRKSGQRTLGNIEARMGSAAFEAEGAIKLARGAVERVSRTGFLPWNKLQQKFDEQTLNPDQAELHTRLQALMNAYSAVMARGANITTDAARGRAESLLNSAANPAVLNRVMTTMQQEIDMAKNSPEQMREFYRKQYGAKSVEEKKGEGPAAAADPLAQAKAAIAAGAPRDAVIKRLKENGIDTSGL